jgi:hypothetical protein
MGQKIRYSDTLVSKGGNYELRFFTTYRENSTKYYVGIRFKKVPNDKVVWVANRDCTFETSSAFLTINPDGNIVIIDGRTIYGVTGVPSNKNSISTYIILLDTGNLILVNTSNQVIVWQSFDYPTDTLLPGMNIGHDNETGHTWSLRSWKSKDDPSPGPYTLQYDSGIPILSVNKGSNDLWIDGNSNFSVFDVFSGADLQYSSDSKRYIPTDSNSRLVLAVSGDLKLEAWSKKSNRWLFLLSSKCSIDNPCGVFSICNPDEAIDPCKCLDGFKPLDADSWKQGNRSAGCVRRKTLSCSNTNSNDTFLNISVESPPPYYTHWEVDVLAECLSICFNDCSCVAYAYYLNGTCMLWNQQVPTLKKTSFDIQDGNNNKLNISFRLAHPERLITSKLKEPTFAHRVVVPFFFFLFYMINDIQF